MAKLGCPCGNVLWNGCDGDETEYYFVENGVLDEHLDDFAFFELEYNDMSTEIWKCDVCDRMMVFDDPCGPVSRYMRRIDADSIGEDELSRDHKSGICFSNLLFNEVDHGSAGNMNMATSRITKSSAIPESRIAARCSHADS